MVTVLVERPKRGGRGYRSACDYRVRGLFPAERAWLIAVPGCTAVHQDKALPQDRAEIWRARAKSFSVRPPAEWVLRVSVTLFQLMVMSGWWLAVSARYATAP